MSSRRSEQFIWIADWDRFQHYSRRNPPWIKNYVELLHDAEYLSLTCHRRGLLHGLWLMFAGFRRRLPCDLRLINSRLGAAVKMPDLEALCDAGFLEVIASDVLAKRLQTASVTASTLLAVAPAHEGADALSREVEEERRRSRSLSSNRSEETTAAGSAKSSASAASRPGDEQRPWRSGLDLRAKVRNGYWQDPHLAETLRVEHPGIPDEEVERLVDLQSEIVEREVVA